jgi:NAD(P)H-nitrite reductase large subunit
MKNDHHVIIGNGACGNRAADILRKNDSESKITIISDEFFPYYYRHRLVEYVMGAIPREKLIIRPVEFYKDNRIRLRLGQRVIKIDILNRILYLNHMEKVHYTRLLLCTGSKPRIPEIHYQYRDHFTVLKDLSHAELFRNRLKSVEDIVMVGGDLVSLRMATALLAAGLKLTFIIDQEAFWPLEVTPSVQKELVEILEKKGAHVLCDDMINGSERLKSGRYLVSTQKGKSVECDLIGAFFGLIPDVDFLLGSGLDIDRGILVDEYLKTQFESVYAAGDCAQVYNPELKNYWVSIGWPNALKLGEVAALNMLGTIQKSGLPPVNILNCEGICVNTSWWRDF